MNRQVSIAIDGPAGAGKSTVAKLVAGRLSYLYIDTGAMYRALTFEALKHQLDLEDGKALSRLLQQTSIELIPSENKQLVFVNKIDVTLQIRSNEVTNHVSFVAKHEEVRQEMVRRQQSLAENGGVVMDGRDIGTHVLPNAKVKIFLSASVEVRASRRHAENLTAGYESNLEQIKMDIALRDKRDSERQVAPLTKAEDAVEIDTTSLSIDEVVQAVLDIVEERI